MTNNAMEEPNLSIIQQRLQILAPLIQDVHNACFNLGKFFVTILIAIQGGAIGIIVTSNDEKIMNAVSYFIIGILCALILAFALTLTVRATVSHYKNSIINNNFDINKSIISINSTKYLLYILIYIPFVFSFAMFFCGVEDVLYIKFRMNIREIIIQNIESIKYGILDIITFTTGMINPFWLSFCILISIAIFLYKKYKAKIHNTVKVILKNSAKIIKQILQFLWIRAVLLCNRAVDFIQNYKREYLDTKSTK